MRIVDPIGTSAALAKTLAARPRTLDGVTIALLAARGGARAVKAWSKPGASTGATPAVLEEIAAAARVALTASASRRSSRRSWEASASRMSRRPPF